MEVASSILCSIVANVIYDIGKYGLGKIKTDKEILSMTDIEVYVSNELGRKYEVLGDSSILYEYFLSPIIKDTICNYTDYVITGKLSPELISAFKQSRKNKHIEESDIVNYLTDNLLAKYKANGVISIPDRQLIEALFKDLITISSDYVVGQLNLETKATTYYVNSRFGLFNNEILSLL